nr:hypothetical protein Iba_chr12cCG9470 [Ipomoea batatas]
MLLFTLWPKLLLRILVGTWERPKKSRSLDDAAVKVSAEEYEYEIFRSPEEYQKANLEPPRYDLPEKYTPQRAAVTVAVKAPLLETSSRGIMRSFPVSARPPRPGKEDQPRAQEKPSPDRKRGKEKEIEGVEGVAPAKRSRRDGSGSTTPVIDVLMKHGDDPSGSSTVQDMRRGPASGEDKRVGPTALVGERIACDLIQMAHSVTDLFPRARTGTRSIVGKYPPLKKALAKRGPEDQGAESKLKRARGKTGRRILERADLGENILTDPSCSPAHLQGSRDRGAVWLPSPNSGRDDLMYEWALGPSTAAGAMQNDVTTALRCRWTIPGPPKGVLAILPEKCLIPV